MQITESEYNSLSPELRKYFLRDYLDDIDPNFDHHYYCPKVSRKERHCGDDTNNNHPTVKPVALMAYLVRLVTPPNGHVLDPFNGSGSTGMACKQEGFKYTGIDLDQAYLDISKKRIDAWGEDKPKVAKEKLPKTTPKDPPLFDELFGDE